MSLFKETKTANIRYSAEQKAHGNPSYSTLRAIAAGFRQDQGQFEGNPDPKLLFFTDPSSLNDVKGAKSKVWQLLNVAPERPWWPLKSAGGANKPVYNYRCFRLRRMTQGSGAGRIGLCKISRRDK